MTEQTTREHLDSFGQPSDPSPHHDALIAHMRATHDLPSASRRMSHTYLSDLHSDAHDESAHDMRARVIAGTRKRV